MGSSMAEQRVAAAGTRRVTLLLVRGDFTQHLQRPRSHDCTTAAAAGPAALDAGTEAGIDAAGGPAGVVAAGVAADVLPRWLAASAAAHSMAVQAGRADGTGAAVVADEAEPAYCGGDGAAAAAAPEPAMASTGAAPTRGTGAARMGGVGAADGCGIRLRVYELLTALRHRLCLTGHSITGSRDATGACAGAVPESVARSAAGCGECLQCQHCGGAVLDVAVVLLNPQALCELLCMKTS